MHNLSGKQGPAKTERFNVTNMILSAVTGLVFLALIFLAVTGHWDLMGIIGAVLAAVFFPLTIALVDFFRRSGRGESRRLRNASMAGREEFMGHVRERNRRILEKREGLSDIEALQRVIDFNKRKGFEQLNEIDTRAVKIMVPASLVVFCISPVFMFVLELSVGIILAVVSLWAFIICLEIRSMTRHQESSIRILEEELGLMRKEERLAILGG